MNQFDYDEGRLSLKALKILEKPAEVQLDDPFLVNASLVTEFIMVKSVEEYQSGQGIKFKPDYMHQVFRESNDLYGYKDFKMIIYFTSVRLIPFVKYQYSERCEDADDIHEGLIKLYESGYLNETQEKNFLQLLEEEQNIVPIGVKVKEYTKDGLQYTVYRSNIDTNAFAEFKSNLQAFLLILIDGASFPCDSHRWNYYVLYRRDSDGSHSFIGLGTVFVFSLGINVTRYRISQMLFLPNFQRKGHGSQFLLSIYQNSLEDPSCKQITVEDPSEDFQLMRDITDTRLLSQYFQSILNIKTIESKEQFDSLALSKEMLYSLMKKSKLYSYQIRRAHQILLFSRVPKSDRILMNEFYKLGVSILQQQFKMQTRVKNPVVVFEDGETILPKQLHLLEQNERMQKRIINYEEIFLEDISFYELVVKKLKKDGTI